MVENTLKALPLIITDVSTLAGPFTILNPGGLTAACSLLRIVNHSDRDIYLAFYDDSAIHEFVPANTSFSLYAQACAIPTSDLALFPKNMEILASCPFGGIGTLTIACYYV